MRSTILDKCKEVGQQAMNLLLARGAPYHEGIIHLVMDLEFHYLAENGEILSSVEKANLYIHTDVRFHSGDMNLSYELGKQIFHFWADNFHPEDYQKVIVEGDDLEGSFMGVEKIIQELQRIVEKIGSVSLN